MPSILSGGISMGILAGVVSGLFYLVVSGLRWAGEVRHYSGEWFNKQLHRHLGTPAVQDSRLQRRDDGSAMDSEAAQVREFIERLVETLISGDLDHVNITRLYADPEYKPLDECDSPSAAHADLKQLIYKAVSEAMTLPALHQFSQNGSLNGKAIQDEINSKTYEEILATAILNKVIQRFQHYSSGSPKSLTDGNSNLYALREMEQPPKFISRVEIGLASSNCGDDDASGDEDGSWNESSLTEPISLMVEESVEEEMSISEEDEGTRGAELDFYLSGLNFIKKHRVPFPELGMDIVDGADSDDDEDGVDTFSPLPTDLLSPVDSWEDNWLFQRRRLKTLGSRDPVPMLVPNPSEDFRALIGDRYAEDISDLSDCSESVIEEILADDGDNKESNCNEDQPITTSLDVSCESPRIVESVESPPREPKKEVSTRDICSSLVDHGMSIVEARNTEFTNGMDSLSEFGQQDSEYTEDYASVTRRQMNSLKRHQGIDTNSKPVPRPRTMATNSSDNSIDDSSKRESTFESSSDFSLESTDSMNEFSTPPRPGTIAEREHRKWETAAPLPNNPYSQENIMRRLSKTSLLNIRTNCNTQLDTVSLPEITMESTMENLASIPLEKDTNITRYGRDYYINPSKASSSCRTQTARPVEIVMTSKPPASVAEVTIKCEESKTQLERLPTQVETKVVQWQSEIDQIEDMWHRKIKACQIESDTNANKTASKRNDKLAMVTNGVNNKTLIRKAVLEKQNSHTSLLEDNSDLHRKQEEMSNHVNNSDLKIHKHPINTVTRVNTKEMVIAKMSTNSSEIPKGISNSLAVIRCERNGNLIDSDAITTINVSGAPSEGSASSDYEHNLPMPSVKDLAKHFSQNNDDKIPQRAPPTEGPTKRQVQPNHTEDGSNQPMREVHSLTARSISREFREELKRNLPSQRDRNVHGSDSSLPRSDSSLPHGSDMDTSTTPGYTSDESSGPSPTPGNLRNNIAFWEQLQRNK